MAFLQEMNHKILIAGSSGMVGSAIYRAFLNKKKQGRYQKTIFFTPTRKELDFSVYSQVEEWFKIHNPEVVIIAAAKVGGIYANKNYPTEFILENLKIQTNLIEVSKLYDSVTISMSVTGFVVAMSLEGESPSFPVSSSKLIALSPSFSNSRTMKCSTSN